VTIDPAIADELPLTRIFPIEPLVRKQSAIDAALVGEALVRSVDSSEHHPDVVEEVAISLGQFSAFSSSHGSAPLL
jgi:hypothetical protein